MTFRVRFSGNADRDLDRLLEFLAAKRQPAVGKALSAIHKALRVIEVFPFSCRKSSAANDPRFRELIVPFGHDGYVLLFEIEDAETVTVLAVRNQLEDDFSL